MTYSISLDQLVKQAQSAKQTQRMIMSPQMQQAIHMLQMPILELSAVLEEELQQNPVIDLSDDEEDELEEENRETGENLDQAPEKELVFDEHNFEILKKLDEEFRDNYQEVNKTPSVEDDELKSFQESLICSENSLFEHLIAQAKETFSTDEEMKIAEALIGNFDENGFLKIPLQEVALLNNLSFDKLGKILQEIQKFDPPGIGAANVQESLLIQLRQRQKKETLSYKIIENHFDDLLHNRIPDISKSLGCTAEEVANAIKQDIARLDLHPGFGHFKQLVHYITPDASIESEGEALTVRVNEDFLPPLRINSRYLRMLSDETVPKETKEFIKNKLISARWLMRNVHQRNETLHRIIFLLADLQKDYFSNPEGKLAPLTMKIIADKLELNESTVARAVSNKYIDSPRGIVPLRSFFTSALASPLGEDISSNTAKGLLCEIIQQEDRLHPLSDAELSEKLAEKGVSCARRTVAKYRGEFNLGNAHQRKKY
jgi:RNA polymerase sigma-54 factor